MKAPVSVGHLMQRVLSEAGDRSHHSVRLCIGSRILQSSEMLSSRIQGDQVCLSMVFVKMTHRVLSWGDPMVGGNVSEIGDKLHRDVISIEATDASVKSNA